MIFSVMRDVKTQVVDYKNSKGINMDLTITWSELNVP